MSKTIKPLLLVGWLVVAMFFGYWDQTARVCTADQATLWHQEGFYYITHDTHLIVDGVDIGRWPQ